MPRRNELTAVVRPETFKYRAEYDSDNYVIYEGWAGINDSTADPVWTICKHTYSNGNLVQTNWAGIACFDQIWDNRASLSYS